MPTPEADVPGVPQPSPTPGQTEEISAGDAEGSPRISLGKFLIVTLGVILVLVVLANLGGGEEASQGGSQGSGGGGEANQGERNEQSPPDPEQDEGTGEAFTNANYSELYSDPDAHEGASVDIAGQLLESPENTGDELAFQMYADPDNLEWNTIVYTDDMSLDLATDDYVRVEGEVLGTFEGENAFGASLEVPMIQASDVQTVSAGQALDPARKVLEVNRTSSDQGFSVTLHKLEFGEESTRAYVTINNNTGRGASFYTFDMKIQQGSRQIDYSDDSYSYMDEEPQSDLRPGVQTEGVLVFGPVDPSQPFEMVLPWSSNNFNVNARPVIFQITP